MVRRHVQFLDDITAKEYEWRVRQERFIVPTRCPMDFDAEKLEEAVLALLYFNSFDEKAG